MNKFVGMGRMVRNPEQRTTSNDMTITNFTLAIDRKFKSASGERETDFINFVSFGKQAEVIARYFSKGSKILVEGRLQVRNWEDKDGNKRTSYDIVVSEFEFVDSKQNEAPKNEYNPVQEGSSESLPFDL